MSTNEKIDDGFSRTYGMELLFEEKPKINYAEAISEIESILGSVEFRELGNDCKLIFILDHTVNFEDKKKVPSQISIFHADMTNDPDLFQEEVQHSWKTPHAQQIIQKTKYTVLVTDFMSSGLELFQRHKNLSTALKAIVKSSNCIGLATKQTQQILDASEFVNSEDPLFGFINIRFFNAGEEGFLMDSLGLSALGLYDVQCHYDGLPPNEVSAVLFNSAYYIFNENPEFENGHTVAGVNNVPWKVQFEDSLVAPNRVVLDFHPGKDFVVGNRK